MNYYYITGTSRGLGKALAEHLLKTAPDNVVIGISRNSSIEHKNYTHYSVDLTEPGQVAAFHFPPHHDAKRIALVNNAGVIGLIKPSGKMTAEAIVRNISVNLTAPALLANTFLEAYREAPAEKIVLNVSSGAGKNPVEGWSAYCATKAGLDMLSRVIAEEQKSPGRVPFHILSVAPGVVDTSMQDEIRSASAADFRRLPDFIGFKTANQLASAESVAAKYAYILDHIRDFSEVVFSVKDLPEH